MTLLKKLAHLQSFSQNTSPKGAPLSKYSERTFSQTR